MRVSLEVEMGGKRSFPYWVSLGLSVGIMGAIGVLGAWDKCRTRLTLLDQAYV